MQPWRAGNSRDEPGRREYARVQQLGGWGAHKCITHADFTSRRHNVPTLDFKACWHS